MSLERRKPLRRKKRLKAVSDKRRAEWPERARVREAVFRRDGWRCRLQGVAAGGPCSGPLECHEMLKASQGAGTYAEENCCALCRGHNQWVEDHPALAHGLGLVIRRGDLQQ